MTVKGFSAYIPKHTPPSLSTLRLSEKNSRVPRFEGTLSLVADSSKKRVHKNKSITILKEKGQLPYERAEKLAHSRINAFREIPNCKLPQDKKPARAVVKATKGLLSICDKIFFLQSIGNSPFPREQQEIIVQNRISSGALGVVYKAEDSKGKPLAVKVLISKLAASREVTYLKK